VFPRAPALRDTAGSATATSRDRTDGHVRNRRVLPALTVTTATGLVAGRGRAGAAGTELASAAAVDEAVPLHLAGARLLVGYQPRSRRVQPPVPAQRPEGKGQGSQYECAAEDPRGDHVTDGSCSRFAHVALSKLFTGSQPTRLDPLSDSRPVTIKLDTKTKEHVARGVDELVAEFGEITSRQTVEQAVAASLESLPPPKFPDFVPVLVHRYARERLTAAVGDAAPDRAAAVRQDIAD
jgi:hypothetical protein